jgi:hypothetical protein
VIVATQTTLKPLLAAGVRPHFVTALDFHEISRRFYTGLEPADVADVTLIAEPKAHPVILDAFPGAVRCCASSFLDELLGPHRREMGTIPAGATVAHLAVYAARHLGCDPIILVGQDLAFTDGLYYAPGTAIGEVWAPELNPFNTIEMMEWQRIVRHRSHLARHRDVHGREIYTDAQMLAYLHQFERDFAQLDGEGVTVIDATEGGLPKQHTTVMPLADALRLHATEPLPDLPPAERGFDAERLAEARQRVEAIAADVAVLRDASVQSARTIRRMLEDQDDTARMDEHFARIEQERRRVEERFEAFKLLQNLNQLGVFKRFKADRRLEVQRDLDPKARQRAQLERDLVNVTWTRDAAKEMADQLQQASELLAGRPTRPPESGRARLLESSGVCGEEQVRIAAMVPVDPEHNGLGVARSLEVEFDGRPVIQATLERLGRSCELASIVLLVPADAVTRVETLLDRSRIGVPVEIEPTEGSPLGPERRAIAAARAWSPTAWRGGISGMSVYDEVLSPGPMHRAMTKRGLTAALLAAPDWPLVAVDADHGVDAVCARHRELPDHHSLVFTHAPPGLGVCVVGATLIEELCRRNRLATVGGLLVYQPQAPQHDPIARSANVSIDERVSRSRVRATCDCARYRKRLERVAASGDLDPREIVARLERDWIERPDELPQHVILELTTARASRGLFRASLGETPEREPLSPQGARRLFEQLAAAGDAVVTLGGLGDPLLHDRFDEVIRDAREAGLRVHVRTELLVERPSLDRLLEAGPDAISVDLHADRAATYEAMMGTDRFAEVLDHIQHLVARRQRLTDHPEAAALALPWIVPRLQRRPETLADIEPFFDRWQAFLGAAVIEGTPSKSRDCETLTPAEAPGRVTVDELLRRMVVLSDGSVPVSELDVAGRQTAGNAFAVPLPELWPALCDTRRRGFETGQPPETWLP